jgi:predicted nucleotidyltransferase
MTKNDILAFLKQHREELRARFGVVRIGLFGSYARDEQRDDSDIDLAIEIDSENSFRSFFGLKAYLEDSFHKNIDLGMVSALKPGAREHILQEIIYA